MTTVTAKIDIQHETRKLWQRESYANVGALVEFCIKKAFEGHDDDNPISEDDIDFRVDPSGWDVAELAAYLDEELGTPWKEVTGAPYSGARSAQEVEKVRAYLAEYADAHALAEYDDAPLVEWEAEELRDFLEDEMYEDWRDVAGNAFDEEAIADEEVERVRDYIRDEAPVREVYEWYAVSDWLGRKLAARGEIVLDVGNLTVWGRQGTGQAVYMDYDIQEIARALIAEQGEVE